MRQVRHVPDLRAGALLRVHPLLDRVLVRAGERGVDELADVRDGAGGRAARCTPRRSRRASSSSERSSRGSTPWVSRFSAIVMRSTLPVRSPLPKRRPLDALGAGHQPELGGRDGRAAVVVRVDGEDRARPGARSCGRTTPSGRRRRSAGTASTVVGRLTIIFSSGVGPHSVRRRPRRSRARSRAPCGGSSPASTGRRSPCRSRAASSLQSSAPRTASSVIPSRSSRKTTRRWVVGGRVVEVDDRARRALDRLVRALDQLGPRLREHGDRRVVRDQLVLDERAARSRSRSSMRTGSRPRSP